MADTNFIPPTNSNNAVMVNDDNVLTNPNVNDFLNANKEIAKASDITGFKKNIDSLTNKTQNITASVGKTTFSGSITSGSILSNNIDVSGNLNVEGTLKASNIGSLIGKSLSVENLTVTDTLTAENFEVDIPDTILNVEGVKSKGIIEANNFQETNPNKFVKGWFLARVENSENDGNKNIYISNKQYSYAEITGAELPSDFETADFSNISVNDVFYFYNSTHFPYAFRVISIYENYLKVSEIEVDSLKIIDDPNLSTFRYGLFIIGTWNDSDNSVIFSTAKIDAGYANFYNNVLAIGNDNSLGYNSCSTGTSCSSIGMYSNCMGKGNVAISYSSTAFGQNNFVLGEKCSAIGANNNIEGGNGNVAFGYNNQIYSSNVGTTISESSVALGQGIKIDTTIHPKISFGQYNVDDDNIIFSIGNGTSDNNRSNAFEVYRDGSFSSPILENLQLFKANTGALHFNGGSLVVGASGTTDKMPSTFSWCRTIKISQEQWSNIENGTYFDGNAGSGIGLTFFKASNGNVGLKYTGNGFTTGNIFLSTEQKNLLLDGNVHTLVVICANETLKLYIDNKLIIDRLVSGATSIPQTKLRYQIDSFTGQYSRIYNFNFDITSADALYTISDYQQGKPIPPSLLRGSVIPDWDNPSNSSMLSGSSFTRSGETINATIYNGGSTTPEFRFNFSGKKGDIVRVKSNITYSATNGSVTNASVSLRNSSNGLASNALAILSETEGTLIATEDFTRLRLQVVTSKTQDEISLTGTLSVEVNGTLLALEDYTINGKVLDYSGNKNHATITGNVMGDNDTRVSAFIEAITTTTSEQN